MSKDNRQIYKDIVIDVDQIQFLGKVSDQVVLDFLIKEVVLGDDVLTQQKRIIIAEAGDRLRKKIEGYRFTETPPSVLGGRYYPVGEFTD